MLEKTFIFTLLQISKNRCELSAIISENFEITCLKWLNNRTCAPVKPSVTNEHFFLVFQICVCGSEMLPKMVKNGVKSEFYCPFLTSILMINLFHKNLNSGKFE